MSPVKPVATVCAQALITGGVIGGDVAPVLLVVVLPPPPPQAVKNAVAAIRQGFKQVFFITELLGLGILKLMCRKRMWVENLQCGAQ
jgi:hypothetical protein